MKKLWLCGTVAILATCNAEAKFNPPSDYITNSQRAAMYQMNLYDADHDGRLSVEEFNNKTQAPQSRDTRRQIRKAKKSGIYQAPDEQFKTIDTNGDEYITLPELDNYISEQIKKTNGRVRYY